MNNPEKYKIAVIKEELVALTGNYISAILLNQFLYWQERIKDFKDFIEEENRRRESNGENKVDLEEGWMYKTAESLSDETMLGMSATSIRKYVTQLVDQGYLLERTNPKYKWDKTKQYRVNFVNMVDGLTKLGYQLTGYKIFTQPKEIDSRTQEFGNGKQDTGNQKQENGDRNNKILGAIPEITTETISNNYNREYSEAADEGQTNNSSKTKPISKTKILPDYEQFFEKLWEHYPKKEGKSLVSIKSKKEIFKIGYDRFDAAIQCYKNKIEKNHTDEQYIMQGNTFFNKRYVEFLDKPIENNANATTPTDKPSEYDSNGVRQVSF